MGTRGARYVGVGAGFQANMAGSSRTSFPSDPMDVDLLSVALPVSDFVLTDRRMELRVKKLELDKKCSVKIYSMSSIDDLFAALEQL